MKIFLSIILVIFNSSVFAFEIERGLQFKALCETVKAREIELNSSVVTEDAEEKFIGFQGTHRNRESTIIYNCGENWSQLIVMKYSSEDEARRELSSYIRELELRYGSVTHLVETLTFIEKATAWFKSKKMLEELRKQWVWNLNGNEISILLSYWPRESKWHLDYTASTSSVTYCVDEKCNKLRIKGIGR